MAHERTGLEEIQTQEDAGALDTDLDSLSRGNGRQPHLPRRALDESPGFWRRATRSGAGQRLRRRRFN